MLSNSADMLLGLTLGSKTGDELPITGYLFLSFFFFFLTFQFKLCLDLV